jgi:S1-C subfamily serine protease
LRIGTGPEVEVHVAHEPSVASHHATLHRRGATYELETEPDKPVWVNGDKAEHRVLRPGDVLEIGQDGPILRFRLYPPGSRAFKSPAEAFADCVDCARHSSNSRAKRAALFLRGAPKELATQTSFWFRGLMIVALAAVAVFVALLTRSYLQLEQRLQQEELQVRGITELLQDSEDQLTAEDLETVRSDLVTALQRVEALEARTDAPARVVAAASRSVVFLQGAYGFIDPKSEEPLRFAGIGPDGQPLRSPEGAPIVGIGGDGPVLEAVFTGTGFVVSEDGLLLTNRHVAMPWDFDDAAAMVASQGLVPAMSRFVGFLPGVADPFEVSLIVASESADLAVLRCTGVTGEVPILELGEEPPAAGDEVIVLGYPTGIRALLARADEDFVTDLQEGPQLDLWELARRLSAAGHIAPLASRGIVAQLTPSAVVYDAETTRGGSGGPVLDFEGRVVAVTSAVVPEFGGSNLGVPADQVRDLLAQAPTEQGSVIELP